ncbi:MAG: ribokinase [Oscillibacter sp.]|nr:ribokinase [Oscillibacter sp.]
MRILNFGSLNIDHTYQVEHFVRPGETLSASAYEIHCGGKGLNQSIALARSGAQVWHAGAVGAGDGGLLLHALGEAGVNTDLIRQVPEQASGHAVIQVDAAGQNCILLYPGANGAMTRTHIDAALAHFAPGDFLVLQNEVNEVGYMMRQAHRRGMRIVLNPSPMNDAIGELPLDMVDTFLLNEMEASDLCPGRPVGLSALRNRFPGAQIVLTLGHRGALCWNGRQELRQCSYSVPVADTTGAGDTFTGFFIGSLAQGCGEEEALRLASIAAALSVTRPGAGESIPHIDTVRASRLTPAVF